MPDQPPSEIPDDEEYISAEDEDFAPEDDNAGSDSESNNENTAEAEQPVQHKKLKQSDPKNEEPAIDQEEVEGLMQDAGKKKRKRKGGADDEDSGGEGGFVKTRSMAATQKEEKKKTLASDEGATIDVDALWRSMNDTSLRPQRKAPPSAAAKSSPSKPAVVLEAPVEAPEPGSDLITITQTYTFAGETHKRTTQVPRDSAQAQAHLENPSIAAEVKQKLGPNGKPLVRPLRRISPFDPNPTGIVKGLPDPNDPFKKPGNTKNKNKGPKHKYTIPKVKQPAKLNVVDKSKLDWAAHVDAVGARDELEAARKDKGNYLEQRDFLDRVEGREDEARAAAKAK